MASKGSPGRSFQSCTLKDSAPYKLYSGFLSSHKVAIEFSDLCLLSQVEEKEHPDDPQENMPQKKKKRRTRPKSLFIPPPPPVCSEIQPGTGGCYQSNLRSPVFLMDHLLQGLVQCSPYTPPPMLSPIREGSGLYFNTLCSSSTNTGSTKMYPPILGNRNNNLQKKCVQIVISTCSPKLAEHKNCLG